MSIIFLTLLFVLISSLPVNAYTYSNYIDISFLPANANTENSISYNPGSVKDNLNKIFIPPGAEVTFGIDGDFSNNIVNVRIFLSKDNPDHGDLTKILDIVLPDDRLKFVKNGFTLYRYGKMYSLNNITLENGRNDLLTVSLSQPLKISEYSYSVLDGVVNVRTVVKNSTDRLLNNVVYTHGEFSLTRKFSAGEEYIYEYVLEYDNTEEYVDLDFPRIYDPNVKQICAASTTSLGNPHNIFLIENDVIYYDTGTTLNEDFCIGQLGYTLNLGRIEVKKIQEDIEEEPVVNEDEVEVEEVVVEEDIKEVLGIEILPKTSKQAYGYIFLGVFLVALGILCYYFTNENSIRNA